MRRSNWTPSIVPRGDDQGDDQNVYLVVDDFGRKGRVWREADIETATLETSSSTCSKDNIKIGCGSSPSTHLRAGRAIRHEGQPTSR